jgi:hypothetical protein
MKRWAQVGFWPGELSGCARGRKAAVACGYELFDCFKPGAERKCLIVGAILILTFEKDPMAN